MLQLHENGHGFEMDRAYDYEAAFAGTSFMKPHLVDSLMFGNELVTIYGDATYHGGLGTFFYDHEGIKAQKNLLVENGKLVGYLSSRETAPLKDWNRSNGTARASSYDRMPLIRMTNINLKPGDWKYDELIEDTQDGYIMDTNISWSIDDLRLSFQFGTEIGWRVKNGEITGLIKKPSYTGITPKFWNSINAICNEKEFKMYGTPNCGKGEPGQTMYTGHGSSPARFENVRIGVM
jgi:TldD protein